MVISLSKTFGDSAQEVKDALLLFSSPGKRDAEIVSVGRRKTGAELAQSGMDQAADHADQECGNWREMALEAVKEFIKHHSGRFQAEDVRTWAKQVPAAPSLRAWGSIMRKAAMAGLIINTGETAKVDNPVAHNANAALWIAA